MTTTLVRPAATRSPAQSTTPTPQGAAALSATAGATSGAGRDTYLDVLRALATLAVVAGHWIASALGVTPLGWVNISVLDAYPALSWVTLAIQPLTIFFLVGGLLSARSQARAQQRGVPARRWVGRRLRRLLIPTAVVLALWLVAIGAMVLGEVSFATIRTVAVVVIQPLWFAGIYAAQTALTPLALAAARRWGYRVPLACAVVVAVVDVLRYGPLGGVTPSLIGLINLVPGWCFAFQLGVGSAVRPANRRAGLLLAIGGLGAWLACVLWGGYPPTPMGPVIAGRVNSHPPSLVTVAAAAMCVGVLWLAEPTVRRWCEARWARRLAGTIAPVSLTVLCWHQVALVIFTWIVALAFPLGLAGVTTAPDGGGWLAARLVALPCCGLVLAALVRLARPLESRSARTPPPGSGL